VRIARTSRWVINPEQSTLLQTWDILAMAALSFVALVTPFQVALLQHSEVQLDTLLMVNFFVDFNLFIDMCLQFLFMCPGPSTYGYVLEHRHRQIVRHYVKTWFVVDLFSTLPFDFLSMLVAYQRLALVKFFVMLMLITHWMSCLWALPLRFQTEGFHSGWILLQS